VTFEKTGWWNSGVCFCNIKIASHVHKKQEKQILVYFLKSLLFSIPKDYVSEPICLSFCLFSFFSGKSWLKS
jgi:hypothetical protein